jgi:hypothetical protein
VEWFGRGPGESYPDRKYGSAVGRHAEAAGAAFVVRTAGAPQGSFASVSDRI